MTISESIGINDKSIVLIEHMHKWIYFALQIFLKHGLDMFITKNADADRILSFSILWMSLIMAENIMSLKSSLLETFLSAFLFLMTIPHLKHLLS